MTLERIETVPRLKERPFDSHKGMYGHVLVIAGGRGKGGAAALVGAAALRSGAGLVTIASPAEVQPTVAGFEPSYMTYPLAQDADGLLLATENFAAIERLAAAADVLAVGPGLGRGVGIRALVPWLLDRFPHPLVLDADALNVLAGRTELLSSRPHPTIVTPHPGEFARLLGSTTAEVQARREPLAVEFARGSEPLVVVLKGAETIVTDGRRIYVNTTGNPGMATGGSGDVLTGVIAAMLGQGLAPFEAAALGVRAHGLAGNIARDQNGEVGMIAGDIVDALADAFYHLGPEDAAE